MCDKNKQSGHLLEIPLIMMATALLVVILLPMSQDYRKDSSYYRRVSMDSLYALHIWFTTRK
jgi:hypothetical protein